MLRANVVVTVVFLEGESSVSIRQHASAYVCKRANVEFLEGESRVCQSSRHSSRESVTVVDRQSTTQLAFKKRNIRP